MDREEEKQKFHDALLRLLYPSPEEEKPESINNTSSNNLNLDHVLDDELDWQKSSSDGDEGEDEGDGPNKLTRAQRKRLRKKKLKQAASVPRRKIMGPLLPSSITACEGDGDAVESEPEGVRQNAAEGNVSPLLPYDCLFEAESKDVPSGPKRNKLKQRRIAKKMARECNNSSRSGKSCQERENT